MEQSIDLSAEGGRKVIDKSELRSQADDEQVVRMNRPGNPGGSFS
jgi:hypothetical protein